MKITRTGANRNAGTSILASDDLAKRNKWNPPDWNKETHQVHFYLSGTDRGSSYRYGVTLSAVEILSFVELAIPKFTTDPASRAIAVGAAASLRELLVPKEPAKQSK